MEGKAKKCRCSNLQQGFSTQPSAKKGAWVLKIHVRRVYMLKGKSQPVSRVLSRTVIHLGNKSPCYSSDLPRNCAGHAIVPLFDLAPDGVYPATPVTRSAVRSYRTISPLPNLWTMIQSWAVYFLRHFP